MAEDAVIQLQDQEREDGTDGRDRTGEGNGKGGG